MAVKKNVPAPAKEDVNVEAKADVNASTPEVKPTIKVGKPIYASLMAVKSGLKAPKDKDNTFGKYKYRSAESILEAVKPLLCEQGLDIFCSDELINMGGCNYIKATAFVIDIMTGDKVEAIGYAREELNKKGMDASQMTGCSSSYARKYALCGLLAIDDTKDADTDEYHAENAARKEHSMMVEDRKIIERSNADGQENMRKSIMTQISNKAKNAGIDNAIINKMVQSIGFKNSAEMSNSQLCEFANNFSNILAKVVA